MSEDIIELTQNPKYSKTKGENRVGYLLLHVGVPMTIWPVPSVNQLDGIKSAQKAGEILRIKIWPILLIWSKNRLSDYRYLFRFSRYQKDDHHAQQIAECFLHSLSLVAGPYMEPNEMSSVIRVPADLIRNTHTLHVDKLIQVEEAQPYDGQSLGFPILALSSVTRPSGSHIDGAWKITPVLLENEELYRSVRFLKASQDDFYVWPGQIGEIISKPDLMALSSFEQNVFENALQNAFKSVEAVLGDPPRDDRKLFDKITAIGLDPDEEVGYINKTPLHKVIRAMSKARDKKAAHGSTPYRAITSGELLEYQACARHLVWAAIEYKMSESIFG